MTMNTIQNKSFFVLYKEDGSNKEEVLKALSSCLVESMDDLSTFKVTCGLEFDIHQVLKGMDVDIEEEQASFAF